MKGKWLQRLRDELAQAWTVTIKDMKVYYLKPGMIMAEDVRTLDGVLLLARGQEVTELNLQRLINFHLAIGLEDTEFLVMKASIPRR